MPRLVTSAVLALRTARHLRASQLFYWPLRRAQRTLPPPRLGRERVVLRPQLDVLAARVAAWGPGAAAARIDAADRARAGRFRFVGTELQLDSIDWTRRYASHLWSYNLHYFDFALDLAWAWRLRRDARDVERLSALVSAWIDGAPRGLGDGWDPYAISVRTVNWAYALLLCGDALPAELCARVWRSVHEQLAHLERRMELHLLANHYQRNLRAVHLGGLLFDGESGARWRRRSRALWTEMFEQVLPDGTHYERSPMYHASALADYLQSYDLAAASGELPADAERVGQRLSRMMAALERFTRSSGALHLFNDSANSVAPPASQLAALAERCLPAHTTPAMHTGAWSLPDGGFFGWRSADGTEQFIVDAAAPAPAYQPGHAHCGLLSYELDLAGRPVVVDAGVSGYDGDPLREYVRSTRAHNTITIDGREQNEMWGTFRVGRRASATYARNEDAMGFDYAFAGAYRPYWNRGVTHHRAVRREVGSPAAGAGIWAVTDRVEGAPRGDVRSYVHLHPELQPVEATTRRVVAEWPDGARVHLDPIGVDAVEVARGADAPPQGWHCPEFGVALPAATIVLHARSTGGRPFGYTIAFVPARP